MASSAQIRRLQKAERAIPGTADEKKIDLSVFSDDEVDLLLRFKQDKCTEADMLIIEHSIGPKISAQLDGEKSQ